MKRIMERDFHLTKQETDYLSSSMNKVSRSFALVTPCFEAPLNHFMSVAYLVCRVVDNIEDCGHALNWKKLRYVEFNHLLSQPSQARDILAAWEAKNWPGLTDDEKKMMTVKGGQPLWQIYSHIPEESRSIIHRWSSIMASGMENAEDPFCTPLFIERHEIKLLEKLSDYNEYCYYVAGTVGHMITELVIYHYGLMEEKARTLTDLCEACGRGLQKTNIVKDFKDDLQRGFCFLPDEWMQETAYSPIYLKGAESYWKRKVIEDVLGELNKFISYLIALPYEAAGYRVASLLCVLPAYQTMLKAAKSSDKLFTPEHQIKISRLTFYRCIRDAHSLAKSNEAISRYRSEIERQIDEILSSDRLAFQTEIEKDSTPSFHLGAANDEIAQIEKATERS
jgi:farnesyl-diphosphate farnesyltransferase